MTVQELIDELSKLPETTKDENAAIAMFDYDRGNWKIEEITEVYPASARFQIILRGK